MLIVETIARIRREHFIKGKTIKEIARDLKVSRNTVRKVLRSGETSFEYERVVQPRPKLGRWAAELDGLLAGNATKSAREQLTLIRIFEELRERGYDGGYDAVRRYARRWSKERGESTAAAYVPLSFAPGEAYQFDWSHEVVLLNGVTVIVKAAHVRLCHSRMLFVRCYPRETQEMVFDAHDRAFALFKGTCVRGIYDNMKTAVETIFVGKGRLYNRRFMQMCSHYLVDPVACTPASGWEKGQVENQVGLVRERFFTPRLRFKTLDELNAWLLDKCIAYAKAHRHPQKINSPPSSARDIQLVCLAQKMSHCKLVGYASAHTVAGLLNLTEAAKLLQTTLDEETAAKTSLGELGMDFNSCVPFAPVVMESCRQRKAG